MSRPPAVLPARFLGTGRATPPGTLTNAELEARLDTTDTWIVERTGIRSRTIGGTTASLAADAGGQALAAAGLTGAELGGIVVATCTPDRVFPSVSSSVAGLLDATCATFDVNGACAGYIHALTSGLAWSSADGRPVLIVGADRMTSVIDPDDRATAILFGDGAGATVVTHDSDSTGGIVAIDGGTDASAASILCCDPGQTIHMEGRSVFKIAVRAAAESIDVALARAGMTPDDLDLLVLHQANERITRAIAARLDLEDRQVVSTLAHTGNASAATIPHALSVADGDGRLPDGTNVVLCGFGAGMTWATALVRWAR
jgi:3-oxoacyl-[acyl-carrier-protein] synthase-3